MKLDDKFMRRALGPERLRIDAYHEAGHVVMNWLIGMSFNLDFIDMYGKAGASAYVQYRRDEVGAFMVERHRDDPRLGKLKATQGVMMCMAGPAAEYKHTSFEGDWFLAVQEKHDSEDDDFGSATAAAKALYGAKDQKWFDFLKTVSQWSHDAVCDSQVWPVVEHLASHLEKSVEVEPYQKTTASVAQGIIESMAGPLFKSHPPIHSLAEQWKQRLV